MKKTSLLTTAFLLIGLLFGTQVMAQHIELGVAKSAQTCANVTDEGFTASFSFSSIDATEVSTEKGVFSTITMNGTYPSGNVGEPMLPAVNKLIAVPYGAKIETLEVKSYSTTVYSLADFGIKTLYPQQPLLFKNQKPEDVPFAYNEKAYATKGFVQRPIALAEIKGTMRGIQIADLTINPVQYDAATNSIRVYNDIVVEVRYNQYDKSASYNEFARTFSPYFAGVYKQMFNWRDDVYDEHPDLWQNPVHMLVVANRMFEDALQEWLAWKTTKGFYLDVNYTDEIGSSASAIRTFIQEEYAKDAPTFLVIVGDKEQVPASATGSQTSCVTDLQYSSVDGDEFPDMYHSRLSATSAAQLTAMLNKALEYEQYTMPDPSYLNNALLIAGADNGYGVEVGRPTIWYASNYYYNTEHGFDNVYEFSHGSYTNCYSYLSSGVGFANYTAHGSQTSWADPEFNVNNVNNLTNEHKYFLAIGNCCQSGDWGYGTCFGEAMVRAENKGAYAYIGSCPNTTWYNDYYFGVGATNRHDGTMPSYEETTMGIYDAIWTDEAYNTVNSILFIGNLAGNAAQALGYEMHSATLYYWQAYHVLGDGSVMPFRVAPTPNTVSHMPTVPIGMDFFTVNANPGSYVGISKDGVLYGAGMIGESGSADIPMIPITSGGDVTICVTHPRHIPYTSVIPAAALDGPYVAVNSYTPANVHVGEDASMSITFKNVGTQATGGTTNVTLSCDDNNLTILNGTGSFGSLNPDATVQVGGFTYRIAEGVQDGARFTINIIAVCGSNTWEGKAIVTAGQAIMQYEGLSTPGGFVPGETLSVVASFKNVGHYKATNAIARISSSSPYVSFVNDTFEAGTVDPSGVATCVFNVIVSANCPTTEQLPLSITLNADGGIVAEGSGSLKNSCNVIFDLSDSYGDGWNGASLEVGFSDGTPSQSLTISNGSSASYTIEIGSGVHVTLTWHSGSWDGEVSFVVRYEEGDVIFQQGSDPASGVIYEFDCNCGGGASIGSFNPVENLQAVANYSSVTLTWTAPAGAINYIISRNGLEIGQTTQTSFTDNLLNKNSIYTYCVVAEYTNGVSVPECVLVEVYEGIEESETEFAIYPNPVNNTLYINGGDAEFSYEMYNGMGQKVANGNANGNTQINVEGMAKGVYFLRLTTGTQVRIERIIVK